VDHLLETAQRLDIFCREVLTSAIFASKIQSRSFCILSASEPRSLRALPPPSYCREVHPRFLEYRGCCSHICILTVWKRCIENNVIRSPFRSFRGMITQNCRGYFNELSLHLQLSCDEGRILAPEIRYASTNDDGYPSRQGENMMCAAR
jgi:hypothetical protein